jgi:hypothetical protein
MIPFGCRSVNLWVTYLVLTLIKLTVLSMEPVTIYVPLVENTTLHTTDKYKY